MKKIETSKKLLIFSDFMAVVVTLVLFIGWFMDKDVSSMTPIILGVYGWVSIAHGFYYNKAKAENVLKIQRDNNLSVEEAISLAGETVGNVQMY